MSIATKLNILITAKSNIKQALEEKGVVMTGVPFTDYHLKIAEIIDDEEPVKEYGVRFNLNSSSPIGERVTKLRGTILYGNDTGLVYNVGTNDGKNVTNSFDYIPLFRSQKVVVEGNHYMKFFPHYAKTELVNDGGVEYEYLWFSLTKHTGYYLPKVFENPDGSTKPYILIGIYEASRDGNGKLRSIPNAQPTINTSAANFLDYARLNDGLGVNSNYLITDIAETNWFEMRQQIRMATRNVQSYLTGATSMAYNTSNNHVTIGDQTNSNQIVLENSIASQYVLYQTISGGSNYTSDSVINYRQIIDIEIDTPEAGKTTFTFDGEPIASIPSGTVIASRAWRTGLTDTILATDGYFDANDQKHPIKIDGIENPFGNIYKNIAGIKIKGDDYYVCYDTTKYNWVSNTDDFHKLSYKVPRSNGWVKELGLDIGHPEIRLPVEIGGGAGSNAHYSDYFYQNFVEDAYRTPLFGGSWSAGSHAGLFVWDVYYGLGHTYISRGARLSYRP